MKYLIIYHKEDNDGLFSMAIIYNYLVNELNIEENNIAIQGHDYTSINNVDINNIIDNYENIIMTDISMTSDKMIELYNTISGEFTWIDHHAPIIKQSIQKKFDNINGLRDTSRSAILNAYRYLYDQLDEKYQNHLEPELLRILSAWDSFSYEREGYSLDFVRNINVGTNIQFKLEPKTIINFVKYNILYPKIDNQNYWINELGDEGIIINEAKDIEYKNIINNFGDFTFTVDNRKACTLFLQGQTSSLIFKSLSDSEIKNGIIFKRNSNATWTISLYNVKTEYDKEFHCGEYLKEKYNGGGHAGAAGCVVSEEIFLDILKSHII